jgi:hypothetical protein
LVVGTPATSDEKKRERKNGAAHEASRVGGDWSCFAHLSIDGSIPCGLVQ